MIELLARWGLTLIIAILAGKLVAKTRLPSIIGWLLTGMVMGPFALNLFNESLLNASFYGLTMSVLETAVGIIIGSELIWGKIRQSGKSIVRITITQSMGTFLFVSLVFGLIFLIQDIPFYLAFIFGGIALATAPVPALSIVNEYKTKGPVTTSLIMIAALDDVVALAVFFTLMAIIAGTVVSASTSLYMIPVILLLPILIGAGMGFLAGKVFRKVDNSYALLALLIFFILCTTAIGYGANQLMAEPMLNYLLIGMPFSAVFANLISEEKLQGLLSSFAPVLNIAFILFIINLGAPLNYRLIFGAGLYTFIYILSRAIGKYFGTYLGAKISHAPETVRKYLGLTLLPHSGVSLVFTGIASSLLEDNSPELAAILGGTIVAAAIINEVIAVVVAKKAFELAGETEEKRVNKP